MNLLIDIGNTRLKWGTAEDHRLIAGQPLVHDQVTRHALVELWQHLVPPRHIAVACVSAGHLFEQVQSAALELWPGVDIRSVKSQAQAFDVRNAYAQPEKLGVDRWLSLVAVRHDYMGPACVIDCGTAITVDVLDANGRHQGGLISPGLLLMKKSLTQGTEQLQFSEANHAFGLATGTEAAIHSGTLSAAVGLIEHVVAGLPENARVILTGGDAELIAEQLAFKPIIDTDIVLRGLSIVLKGSV
ncbi:MAG: type III pantothenate kinase [Methylobacter sp.]|uniref:type III pantothenate kinase n=1 Tax=Methylobacter sp. TaxID=2051955 RepID=UPI0025836788|nr:type III pantothenate kinase [Methylobacter sp.]MCL7423430.1 type III pantothenate kinase [Methylobacter sp.]